jgi:hypothetical protein
MAGRFLAIAAVTVIALLGGLWFLMHDGEESVAGNPPRDAAPVAVAPPVKPQVVEPTVKRTVTPPIVLRRPTQQPTQAAPATPGTNAPAPTLTEDAAAPPPTITEALREQVLLTESQILECNDKALKAGKRLDGEAAYGFTIARKDGKITIESTGVEYTNFDGPTSDCFRETANAMVFDALPDGVEALTAYRKVVFHDGALKRQWMTEFAVTRPPPPPPKP